MFYENEPEVVFEHAKLLVAQGISVIPTGGGISPKAKQPHHQALKATGHFYLDDKGYPRSSWKAMQKRLPIAAELEAWYLEHRARGVGFVTGQLSGYVAVDVDLEGLGLVQQLGWKPHVLTPSGGMHFYLPHPGWYVPSNAAKNKSTLPRGFDIRGDGGYCMYPPSRNRDGQYRRTDEQAFLSIESIPLSVTVQGVEYHLRDALGLLKPQAPAPQAANTVAATATQGTGERVPVWLMLDRAAEYASDSRSKGAFMLGLWMHANGYTLDEALAQAEVYTDRVRGAKAAPFTLHEAITSIRSAYRYPKNKPWVRQES